MRNISSRILLPFYLNVVGYKEEEQRENIKKGVSVLSERSGI
ncbi:hypothetical protein BSM4216_3203 [Bacillus smithii]|nr:hypothetical protein BSM4216_3203 [Bacillus smithii]